MLVIIGIILQVALCLKQQATRALTVAPHVFSLYTVWMDVTSRPLYSRVGGLWVDKRGGWVHPRASLGTANIMPVKYSVYTA